MTLWLSVIAVSLSVVAVGFALRFAITARRPISAEQLAELVERRADLEALAERARGRSRWRLHTGIATGIGLVIGGISIRDAIAWSVLGIVMASLGLTGLLIDIGGRRRLERALRAVRDQHE